MGDVESKVIFQERNGLEELSRVLGLSVTCGLGPETELSEPEC